jgi:hypothetical protein
VPEAPPAGVRRRAAQRRRCRTRPREVACTCTTITIAITIGKCDDECPPGLWLALSDTGGLRFPVLPLGHRTLGGGRATVRHEDIPDLGIFTFVSKIGATSSFARLAAGYERFLNSTFTQHCTITCYIRLLGILRARPRKYQRHHTIIFRVVALGV